ncbi:MAG: aminoglycoside phosphotransferase [Ilumatobacteraceae bacterium]|nr:aminoglycoside phosphotransferase [Ilumatobacteraceae bacterium]
MAIPDQRDLVQTRATLRTWLQPKLQEATDADVTDVEISDFNAPQGSGYSNETLLADVTWKEGGEPRTDSLVIRIEPKGYKVFLEADFELQHRMLSLLDRDTDVTVPPTLWLESDESLLGARFFVMRRITGAAPADVPPYLTAGFLFDATPEKRRTLWTNAMDAMIKVHSVPVEKVKFLDKPELGETGFDQIFEYWRKSYEWSARGEAQPVADYAWKWMNDNMPTHRPTALSWGDARLGNMMFDTDTFEVTGVLDWEMLSLGGPSMDLGWWLFLEDFQAYGLAPLEGMGTREETVAYWEAGTGQTVHDLHWYEVFAGFRFACVMMRIIQMYGEPGDKASPYELDNPVTRVLAQKLGIHPFES